MMPEPRKLFIFISSCVLHCVYGSVDQYRLVHDLMLRYNKHVQPSRTSFKPLNVTFATALAQIIDVDDTKQIMTTNMWINQRWIDPRLRWEPAKYGNLSVIRIPYDSVWLPDIVLYNSAHITSELGSTNVIVSAEGNVVWLSKAIFKSSCAIDVKYFPFDTQNCSLSFSSWTHDGHDLNLLMQGDRTGDTTDYIKSREWHLLEYLQEREEVMFSCCVEPYIFIRNHIVIQRKPLFYVFNMLVPGLLITLMALLGFCMPSNSGEKISMGVIALLSMIVFLMIIANITPPTSDDVPLISLYYGITIVIVSFATAMNVFTLNIHHKGGRGRKVPPLVKKVFFGFFAKVLFIHVDVEEDVALSRKGMSAPQNEYYTRYETPDKLPENGGLSLRFSQRNEPMSPTSASGGTEGGDSTNTERQFLKVLQKVYQTIEKNEMRQEDQDRKDTIRQEWQQLALIVDRMLLVCFVILTTLISLALILPGYSSQAAYD